MSITYINGGVCAPKGFLAAGIHCGIRKNADKKDLALIVSETVGTSAACYTRNKVYGAPITVTREHLANGHAQAMLCNSGNANTCNGDDGVEKAIVMCRVLAKTYGMEESDVIVASTGVIGQPLPIEPIVSHMEELVDNLQSGNQGNQCAGTAIMTTDTVIKECAVSFMVGGTLCHMGGIAKGSGMIEPNLATMLAFITSDVSISPSLLQKALSADIVTTYNMVSVDGDTSTNDMVCIIANGQSGNMEVTEENEDYLSFVQALHAINSTLCKKIAKDGEGATKLITCVVKSANSGENARKIAKSVIKSTLFKCAVFGCDANWGRILCAIGYTEGEFDVHKIDVWLQSKTLDKSVQVCHLGAGLDFSEEDALSVLQEDEVVVLVEMNDGQQQATAWGCDMTYDYVKINGDYRT